MAFNAKNFILDKVRRVTEVNLATGNVNWTMISIESPQIEFTGESTDKTDAQGTLLARFDTAKGVNFSGEGSLLSMPAMASQLGTNVQYGTASKPVTGKTFEVLKVDPTAHTATMSFTPKVAPTSVYGMSEDKNIDEAIAVGAETGNASINNKVITMPDTYQGAFVGVLYEYENADAIKVLDSSENYAEAAEYIVDILAADVCNPSVKRKGSIVFPKAKIDNNFTIDLTTEGSHPFSFSALKDYCAESADLCYFLFNE